MFFSWSTPCPTLVPFPFVPFVELPSVPFSLLLAINRSNFSRGTEYSSISLSDLDQAADLLASLLTGLSGKEEFTP